MTEGAGQRPPTPPDQEVITPDQAKDPILILILALFVGGVAYFVLGQWQKGLAAVAVWLAGLALAIVTCGIGGLLFFPLAIAIAIDAYMQANCLKEGHSIGQWTFFSNHV